MKEFQCSDVGMKDCNFKAQGKDDQEVLRKAEEHGKQAHGFKELSPEMKDKVRGVIREAKAA